MLPDELRLGSEAQLRGELAQDFTAHCRESLIASLTDAIARPGVRDENDHRSVSWLLVSVDPEVLLLALEVCSAHRWFRSRRCHGLGDFSSQKEFSYGWPGSDEPLDLMSCIHGCATPEATRLASSLYFEFYQGGKLHVIQVGMEELQSQDCLPLFNGLVREFRVPEDVRFALLTRIRFAKAFPCTADRHQYVKILLHSLAAGCRFPHKQLKELVNNQDIPESLRVAAIYAFEGGRFRNQELLSPGDRDAMVHAFLDRGLYSSELIKAVFYCSSQPPLQLQAQDRRHRRKLPLTADMFGLLSLDEVLAWLRDELDEEKCAFSHFEEHADLAQKQRIVQGLLVSQTLHDDYHDKMTKEQSLMRNQYLEKILDDANLLERSSDSDGAVHLSSNGWKIVEACMEHFARSMQPGARSKMVGLVLGGMPSIPESLLKAAMGDDNGLLAIHLLQAGGYKFLDQLPSSAIGSCLWIKDPVDDTAYVSLSKLAEQLGRGGSSSEEDFEKLVKFMHWMLRCNSVGQVLTGSLNALVTSGALERLLEAVRRWFATSKSLVLENCFRVMEIFVKHRWKWERVLEQTEASRMLCLILDTVLHILNHCDEEQLNGAWYNAGQIIRRLCPPAADTGIADTDKTPFYSWLSGDHETPDYEMKDMASSRIGVAPPASAQTSGTQMSPPPLLEMTDLLLKLNVQVHSLVLTIWRRYDRSAREQAFLSLLQRLESQDPAVVAAAARLVDLLVTKDTAAADAVRDKKVASKLLELAFSAGLAGKIVPVLDVLYRHDDDGNPFARSERSEEEQRKATSWLGSYVRMGDPSDRALLRFVETLTRNHKFAMELVSSSDFASLFQHLLKLHGKSSSSPRVFFDTVWHFLEDREMLYNRMVEAMHDLLITCNGDQSSSMLEVGEFLNKLSYLAYREPAVFMQASSDTCQLISRAAEDRHYIVLRDRDGRKGGGSVLTRHFRKVFASVLDLGLADVELLTEICDRLGRDAVDLVLHQPATLDRVLKDNCPYDVHVFLDVVEKHNEAVADEVRARVYSYENADDVLDLSIPEVSDVCVVRKLCELDLDHPRASESVNYFVGNLLSTAARPTPPESSPASPCGPEVSSEGMRAFCMQMAQASVSATTSINTEEAATEMFGKMTLDDGGSNLITATPQDGAAKPTTSGQDIEDDEMESADETKTDSKGTGDDDEEQRVNRLWRIDNGDLEKIVRLLWLSNLNADSVRSLLEKHTDHHCLARILVAMVLEPGDLRAFGSEGNGHWHRNPIGGVPRFVAGRVIDILHRLADHHGFSLLACISEDDAVSFVSLMLKISVPVEKLLGIIRKPVSFSVDNISKLCSLFADTESLGDVLAHLIASNPALAPAICSTMVSTSAQLINSTLGKLDTGDHTSNTAVLRFVRAFDRVVAEDDTAARQLKLSLDPLWIHAAHDHRSARPLLQALFLAQIFSSEPADSAVQLANELVGKNTDRDLDLVLPLLWKWPALFTVDLDAKLELLQSKVEREPDTSLTLSVNRDNVLKDSYEQFAEYSIENLRQSKVDASFKGEGSEGDYGGAIKREWFQLLSRALKDEDALLFSAVGDCYQPNPHSSTRADHLSYFKFVGRFVAEAIIEDVKLDISFTPSFLKHILGRQVSYKDMDPGVSKSLAWLLENEVDESMGLTFSVDVISSDASKDQVFDLVPGGRDIFVTDKNKHEYVDRVAKYHLTDCITPQMDAFLEGFFQLVPKDAIRIFSELELAFLISGSEEIDVAELKREEASGDEYADADVVKWFWDIVEGFDKEDKARLLKFITGSAKTPHCEIGIYLSDEANEVSLPTASCFNTIDLPRYKSRDQLEQKLLLAIREGCEGFYYEE